MQTIKVRVGEVFITEIECAEMQTWDNQNCYTIILDAWRKATEKKPERKSLTVKLKVEDAVELLSWAEFNASANDEDAADYLPLRAYCRRLIRRVRQQGFEYKDGQIVQTTVLGDGDGSLTAKVKHNPTKPVRKPSAKPKPVRKMKPTRVIGQEGFLINDLLGLSGGMDDK